MHDLIPQPGAIVQTIQLALTPVFMLVAIGNILNILSTRLGRVVDRARKLEAQIETGEGRRRELLVKEIRLVDRRIALVTRSIRALVISALTVGSTVAILFVEELLALQFPIVAAITFLIALVLLLYALVLFLIETQVAAEALRIPRGVLEQDRQD